MSASRGRIVFMHRTRPWRRWALAGSSAAVAAAVAWMTWSGDEAQDVQPEAPRVHAAPPAPAIVPPALVVAAAPAPAAPPPTAIAPIAIAPIAAPTDTPSAPPLRVAVDSGRAQPVFLGWMGKRAAHVGQPFSVDVTAESENDFAGGTLVVEFDAKLMKVAGVRAGSYMSQAGATATLMHAVDAGRLTIDIAEQAGGPPVSGGGTLLTVEFVPTQRGSARVSMASAVLRDLNNDGVPSSMSGPLFVAVD
jgi:hypothetical protein